MFKNAYPWLRIFENIFVRLSLFHFSSALLPLILLGGSSEGDGLSSRNADLSLIAKVNLLIYFVTLILVILRWKKVLNLTSRIIFFWPFIILVSFSPFWSSMPETTFRAIVYGLGTTLFGIYFASRYTLKEQLDHLAWTLAFILFLSLFFVVALPYYGIMGGIHAGAVRGIYVHKNVFSPMIVLSVIVFFLQAIEGKEKRWLWWGLFAVSIAFGILSRSSTALGLMVIMLFLCLCFRIFRWQYEMLVSSILFGLIVGSAGFLWFFDFGGAELIFNALGKDPTLSRRTEIWYYVVDSIQQQPWLGYGLRGFWNGINGPSADIEHAMRVSVHYSHNGFLEICLSFGLIGLALFAMNFFLVAGRSLLVLRESQSVAGFWPLILLTFIIFTNLTEDNIANLSNISWALYTALSFSLVTINSKKMFF